MVIHYIIIVERKNTLNESKWLGIQRSVIYFAMDLRKLGKIHLLIGFYRRGNGEPQDFLKNS